jgi:hypothetical protein
MAETVSFVGTEALQEGILEDEPPEGVGRCERDVPFPMICVGREGVHGDFQEIPVRQFSFGRE